MTAAPPGSGLPARDPAPGEALLGCGPQPRISCTFLLVGVAVNPTNGAPLGLVGLIVSVVAAVAALALPILAARQARRSKRVPSTHGTDDPPAP